MFPNTIFGYQLFFVSSVLKGFGECFCLFRKQFFLKQKVVTKILTNPYRKVITKLFIYGTLKRRVSKSRVVGGRARTLGRLNDFLEQAKDFKRLACQKT
jgi:hypothetical protein